MKEVPFYLPFKKSGYGHLSLPVEEESGTTLAIRFSLSLYKKMKREVAFAFRKRGRRYVAIFPSGSIRRMEVAIPLSLQKKRKNGDGLLLDARIRIVQVTIRLSRRRRRNTRRWSPSLP